MAARYIGAFCASFLSLLTPHQEAPHGVTIALDDAVPMARTIKPRLKVGAERDRYLLAMVMFGEARQGGVEAMRAVGWTVINRQRAGIDHRYGAGLEGVVFHRLQYSCWYDGNREAMRNAGKAAPHSPDGIAWTQARGLSRILLGKHPGADPTKGSVYYHAATIKPAWMHDRGMRLAARIGGHIFYRKDA